MNSDDRFLERAARRAATGPAPLLAALIERWRKTFPNEDVETALGSSPEQLIELSLCRRPRDEHWIEDATEIASALMIDPDRLTSFLRTAEAAERFAMAHPNDLAQQGRLLAARDRIGDDDDGQPEN
ncbi:hypothetical protein G9X68_25595 [Rhizobium sp. WYCCWR 11279]|uniref:hypothetical protein n=1 Tax=Rhizobium changzhiense TaxID=2692317 RepID=UPI001490FC25|nr:hypothetical protein [Rhizobium changzhiense]NNU50445.1 hypothetical protein [Rhizobium changzhiense]